MGGEAINPNWAQLQQKLKTQGGSRYKKPSFKSEQETPQRVLGKRKERTDEETETGDPPAEVSPLIPTNNDCSLTDAIAMDCEMVGVGSEGTKSALGRVTLVKCVSRKLRMVKGEVWLHSWLNNRGFGTIMTRKVNTWGNVIYDEFVRPFEHIADFRTSISGIRPRDMRKAKDFRVAQKKVAELINGRILVGHSLHNDLKVLLLSHPKNDVRDTSEYQPFLKEGRKRSLQSLAAEFLSVKIQHGEHCPVEDARAAMMLYQKNKKMWERSNKAHLKFKEKHKNGRPKKKKKTLKDGVFTAN